MKTLKITTDNKISIVDVDFKDFRSIQQEQEYWKKNVRLWLWKEK